METLGVKRARLQRACSAWRPASPGAVNARWFEYLDAKQRLTSAHAGQRVAA